MPATPLSTHAINPDRVIIRPTRSGPLRKGEDRELIAVVRAGGPRAHRAKERLLEGVRRYVIAQAAKFAGRGVSHDDLVQEAMCGVLAALEKYDVDRGFSFLTYADEWIAKYLHGVCERLGSAERYQMRIPGHQYRATGRVQKVLDPLREELGREPSPEELAERARVNVSQAEMALDLLDRSYLPLDARQPTADDSDAAVADALADPNVELPEQALEVKAAQQAIQAAWMELQPQEQLVLCYRLGLGCEPQSIEAVARLTGILRGQVSAVSGRALRKLHASPDLRQVVESDLDWRFLMRETDFFALTLKLNGRPRDLPAVEAEEELDELEALMASNGV